MSEHPYKKLPDYCFWSRSIGNVDPADVDPVVHAKFQIAKSDRIATGGSCFAQHLARHLARAGFNYFVTESLHPLIPEAMAKDYGYGVFSARYGNVYTARQLLQLLRRAYGDFVPKEDVWQRSDGRLIDPFRPQIQPNGFSSQTEYLAARRHHFSAIRRAIEQLAVFVFTLGLTEAWMSTEDGAVYPLCPGVSGGEFDATRHMFVNFRVNEVIADMQEAIDLIREKNPSAKVILTVSPVPLAATAEDKSVLTATILSKSVLRVAADEIARQRDYVAYFPSFEIITGTFNRGEYFGADLRAVTESGVNHVMRLFMKHYAHDATSLNSVERKPYARDESAARAREAEEIVNALCEEELLDAKAV